MMIVLGSPLASSVNDVQHNAPPLKRVGLSEAIDASANFMNCQHLVLPVKTSVVVPRTTKEGVFQALVERVHKVTTYGASQHDLPGQSKKQTTSITDSLLEPWVT